MNNYVQNNKRLKYNKNLLEKLKEFILTLVLTKESLTTIQSKYSINIFTYIVGQKGFLQFSSTEYDLYQYTILICVRQNNERSPSTLNLMLPQQMRPRIAHWSINQLLNNDLKSWTTKYFTKLNQNKY